MHVSMWKTSKLSFKYKMTLALLENLVNTGRYLNFIPKFEF